MVMEDNQSLVFRIDPKLLQPRPPRLTLAATLRSLGDKVESGELDANVIVDILDENRLLPYIISNIKNLEIVALGQITNASKIGDIVASEECIKGTYELCLSFLRFVLVILRAPNYADTSKAMLASVTYIVNEIYPNHHIWTYRNIPDMYDILSCCTDVFHQIIVVTSSDEGSTSFSDKFEGHKASVDLNLLETVCIISLSQNQAHKQLLDVIVESRQAISKIISETTFAGEETLRDTLAVRYVRKSLSIFSRVLARCDSVKTHLESSKISQPNDGSNDQTTSMTSIERALFDTSIRPGLLQHLFSYVYQKEDNKTACLAIDLIKRIAEKFSMSLMACLGSEADRVCKFFMERLDSTEANTELDTAIIDLLSTCVRHQPGLIELFLNYKRDSTLSNNETSKDKKHSETLRVIINLLKNCREKQDDSYKTMNTHVMRFILTFWQKSHSAIEQFDKEDDFWELITHPLIKFIETNPTEVLEQDSYPSSQALNERLCSYVLMIIARELFNSNSGITDRKMNPKLRDRLDELNGKNIMGRYSSFVIKRYSTLVSNLDKSDSYIRILSAWRDFLASYCKYEPFEVNTNVKFQIISDLLKCLTIELSLNEKLSKERIASIGETLLLIWLRWTTRESAGTDVFKSIHELMYLADVAKEHLPFSFLLTFQSTLNLYLIRSRDHLVGSKHSFDLLVPALQLMQFSIRIMEKFIVTASSRGDSKPGVDLRLCQASIMTFRFIIDIARPHVSLWVEYVKTNLRADALVQFLGFLVIKGIGSEVCLSLIELLICLASIKQTADYLSKSALMGYVNTIAVSAYEGPHLHLTQLGSNRDWLAVYQRVLRLNIEMILTLGNDYTLSAVEFLSTHCIRICELIEGLRTESSTVNMDEALQTVYLINLVLRRGCVWERRSPQSFKAISDEIDKTTSCVSQQKGRNLRERCYFLHDKLVARHNLKSNPSQQNANGA